jgi:hypothetical protein
MAWKPGESGNPAGRPPSRLSQMERFDLREAARRLCPKALQRAEERLDSKDERVVLAAAELILSYGFGKPQVAVELNANHAFVIAPNTMEIDTWLQQKGQPSPDSKSLAQQRKAEALPAAATGDAPQTIDLNAEPEPRPNCRRSRSILGS